MFKLKTLRLGIVPLDSKNLNMCIEDYKEFEHAIGAVDTKIVLSEREKKIYNIRLNDVKNNPDKYVWYTVWMIILRENNHIIGNIMLKGEPNENGEVIIGYAIKRIYRCNGYMTEALESMIQWCFQNNRVKSVVADTLKENISSQKVLEKIGMKRYKEDMECYWYKISKGL